MSEEQLNTETIAEDAAEAVEADDAKATQGGDSAAELADEAADGAEASEEATDENLEEPEAAAAETETEAETADGDAEPTGETGRAASSTANEKPKSSGIGDLVAVGILSLILGLLLAVPMSLGGGTTSTQEYDLTGGVAATFDGIQIGENDVTNYVTEYRTRNNMADEESWGQWLADTGYDAQTIREETIQSFVDAELVNKKAAELGVSVTALDVEKIIEQTTEELGGEQALESALAEAGMTLDQYRNNIETSLVQEAVANALVGDVEVTDAEIIELLSQYGMIDKDASSLESLDESTVEQVRSMIASNAAYEAYEEWLEQSRAAANLTITDMPEGLPYDVDASQFTPSYDDDEDFIEFDDEDLDDEELDDEDVEIVEVEEEDAA